MFLLIKLSCTDSSTESYSLLLMSLYLSLTSFLECLEALDWLCSSLYLLFSLLKLVLDIPVSDIDSLGMSLIIYIFSVLRLILLLGRLIYGLIPQGRFCSRSFLLMSIGSKIYFSKSDYFKTLDESRYFTQLSILLMTLRLHSVLRSNVLFLECFSTIFSIDFALVLVLHNLTSDIIVLKSFFLLFLPSS